ncbi:MAG: hypothetical protein JSS49_20565 [Planctomycetes bacterium]|nr:hypothetical protein [Planctomycetota bacterium]
MAKKKVVPRKAVSAKRVLKTASPSRKVTVRTKPSGGKSVAKKAVPPTSVSRTKATKAAVTTRKAPTGKVASQPPVAVKPVPKPEPEVSLGRPLVTQEEKLYMLFHNDYHARQVFEFLRVETVKELEQYSPQQIIHLLSKPIRTTVDRIRQRLAELKRSLREDESFAAAHQPK